MKDILEVIMHLHWLVRYDCSMEKNNSPPTQHYYDRRPDA